MSSYTYYECDHCGKTIQGGRVSVYVSEFAEEADYHFCPECRARFRLAMSLAVGRVRREHMAILKAFESHISEIGIEVG